MSFFFYEAGKYVHYFSCNLISQNDSGQEAPLSILPQRSRIQKLYNKPEIAFDLLENFIT